MNPVQLAVWDLDLPFNKAWVLMAIASHSKIDGTNAHPSIARIAWMTGYSRSSVERAMADLRDDGILVPTATLQGGVRVYSIQIGHIARKPEYKPAESGRPSGVPEKHPRNGKKDRTPRHIDVGFYDVLNKPNNSNSSSTYVREEDMQIFEIEIEARDAELARLTGLGCFDD